jgi:hypothetical protein
MSKPFTLLILSLLFFQPVKAQMHKDTLVYYMKNNGRTVVNKALADYYLIILPADNSSGKTLYPINEYYPSGRSKLMGLSDSAKYNRLKFEGSCISYYANGHKKSISNYSHGVLAGDETLYYPNGSICANQNYSYKNQILLIECRDSTGKILAENGNGKWLRFNDENKGIEEGMVKDSLEDGEWKETVNDSLKYITVYNRGLVVSTSDPGKALGERVFTAVENEPQFANGGAAGFNQFLGRTVRFPAYDREHGVAGKVITTFIVEKDGSLSNIRSVRYPDKSNAEAAENALKLSPPWTPGMQNGQTVRTQYTISFAFNFANN